MKKLFRFWAWIFILATPKTSDDLLRRSENAAIARFLILVLPSSLLFGHTLVVLYFPTLIHFSAVAFLLILIPMFAIGMLRLHKLKVYFQRRQNTL